MTTHQHKIELNAQVRTVLGSKVSQLRRSGFVPAVLYGKDQEPISLQVPQRDFNKTFHAAGESTLVYVTVGDKAYPTIIHDIARDPSTDAVIHADFYKVNLSEKIKTSVPVVFSGESTAVKDGGILVRNVNELEVVAFPQDLPHEITVDISKLEKFGDHILVKDINLGSKVQVIANVDDIVVAVQEPISEEKLKEMLETTSGVEDVEVIEKEKPVEIPEEGGAEAPAAPEPKK